MGPFHRHKGAAADVIGFDASAVLSAVFDRRQRALFARRGFSPGGVILPVSVSIVRDVA